MAATPYYKNVSFNKLSNEQHISLDVDWLTLTLYSVNSIALIGKPCKTQLAKFVCYGGIPWPPLHLVDQQITNC